MKQRKSALTQLPEEQKLELIERRIINGDTYVDLVDWLKDTYDYDAAASTVSYFFNSVEGEKLYQQKFQEIRDTFADEPLVDKSTRVLALRDKALKLREYLNLHHEGEEYWLDYSAEYRQYLKMIKDEMEGLKINIGDEVSPFERMKEKILEKIEKQEG